MPHPDVTAIILAAGKGTRMRSDRAKVLHELAGRPLLDHVLTTCRTVGVGQIIVVVGHQREAVAALATAAGAETVVQDRQLGTGHAVLVCADAVRGRQVLVLCGDAPLVTPALVERTLTTHRAEGNRCTAVAAEMPDPTGYGRMVLDADGRLAAIVEERDADPAQRAITLINTGIYALVREDLFARLAELRPENASGEYYLTDVPRLLARAGERVGLVITADVDEALGINTPAQLAQAAAILRRRGRG
jgi:bifunctional UDP-N-acetylglucosamine pyrophosphorylase/glucosamine-1-phosphate N-acetyltransferase